MPTKRTPKRTSNARGKSAGTSKRTHAHAATTPRQKHTRRSASAPLASTARVAPTAEPPTKQPSVHRALLSDVAPGAEAHTHAGEPTGWVARTWAALRGVVRRAFTFA